MKKVSIIIPVYNAVEHLDECIKSWMNQTYKNIEIILVNDGSKDDSLKICKNYSKKDKRIVVIDKENGGVCSARNVGIKKAFGDYIAFSDSDDIVEKDEIEYMVSIIEREKVDVVRTNFTIDGYIGELTYDVLGKIPKNDIYKFKKKIYSGEVPAYVWLLLIKKDFLLKNNLFFDESLVLLEDTDFYIRMLDCINSLYVSDKVTYNYILYGLNNSINPKRYLTNAKNTIKFNKKVRDYVSNESDLCVINTSECNLILEYLVISIVNDYDKYKKELFDYLIKDINFKRMLFNSNYNKLKKYCKVAYRYVIDDDYDGLISKEDLIKKLYSKKDFYNNIDYKKRRLINKYITRPICMLKNRGNR